MPFFYHANMTVHGMLWYHSVARAIATPKVYAHAPLPIIHNYGLTLELAGFIVDPDVGFVSIFNQTKYKPPIELYRKYGIYAYPALITNYIPAELLMSAKGEPLIEIKKRGRLAYPDLTKNTVLMPGSQLETLVISEDKLPSTLVLNIGSKRDGVLLAKLNFVQPEIIDSCSPNYPYNIKDVEKVKDYITILKHEAGDIAYMGNSRCYSYKIRLGSRFKDVSVPVLKG